MGAMHYVMEFLRISNFSQQLPANTQMQQVHTGAMGA